MLSSDLNGNNIETILEVAIVDPEQIAVDWIGNNIYVVETEVSRIEVCSMDGRHRASVITDGIERPRGLALDSTKGYVRNLLQFWGDNVGERLYLLNCLLIVPESFVLYAYFSKTNTFPNLKLAVL